ncbi:MAG: YgiQ family radical SAM protein, partial [Methylococcales bacterium]
AGKRPDRCVLVYSQRCREAFRDVPIVIGGIEASLRRIAHYDYWSDQVRRSILLDARADLLVFGNGERPIVEITHRLAAGHAVKDLCDIRGTALIRDRIPDGWREWDSSNLDEPGPITADKDPYAAQSSSCSSPPKPEGNVILFRRQIKSAQRDKTVVRLPAFDAVRKDPVLYAHASRILHAETNPGNALALVQRHGDKEVWLNPPAIPLSTEEMDGVYELPYSRLPHRAYAGLRIPAFEMIQHSVTIMRGCFGGCTFCSITEHEGRIIQNRSEDSVIREIEKIRDQSPHFTGVISDIGGPTANMYRLACKDPAIEAACRRPSCVYPGICKNLNTDHSHLLNLYRRARELPGIKKVLVASGLRYDLAIQSPEYVKE